VGHGEEVIEADSSPYPTVVSGREAWTLDLRDTALGPVFCVATSSSNTRHRRHTIGHRNEGPPPVRAGSGSLVCVDVPFILYPE